MKMPIPAVLPHTKLPHPLDAQLEQPARVEMDSAATATTEAPPDVFAQMLDYQGGFLFPPGAREYLDSVRKRLPETGSAPTVEQRPWHE